MKDLDPLYSELNYYFSKGKLSSIPQKERDHILENVRLKSFEYLEKNLQTFNDENLDFIIIGLSKLGIKLKDLFSNPLSIDNKIIDILFELTLKIVDLELKYYFISDIKEICEVLINFQEGNSDSFDHLKNILTYYLTNYDLEKIKYLWDEYLFNYLEEEVLIKIYEAPDSDLENKLNEALYENGMGNYCSREEAAENIYIKLGEYGINPLLKWIPHSNDVIGTPISQFFRKMGTKIVNPFKIFILECIKNNDFSTINELMSYDLIKLLDKNIVVEIFWDKKNRYLQKIIDICLEKRIDMYGEYAVYIIRKIGGNAFKILYKAFKFEIFAELLEEVIFDFRKTEIEEIINLKEGILYAYELNELFLPLIVILFDSVIKKIPEEDQRYIILNTSIIENILEDDFYWYNVSNFEPLQSLNWYCTSILSEKILVFFKDQNIPVLARILSKPDYYNLGHGMMMNLNDWKLVINNPDMNVFEILTSVLIYKEDGFNNRSIWGIEHVFQKLIGNALNNSIYIKIIESFKYKIVNAIYSVFEAGIINSVDEDLLLKLVEESLEVCITSQNRNFSYRLQTLIDNILEKRQNH